MLRYRGGQWVWSSWFAPGVFATWALVYAALQGALR